MTVLNINDKPLIRSFTHDADYLAIVTADSMAGGRRSSNWPYDVEFSEKGTNRILCFRKML